VLPFLRPLKRFLKRKPLDLERTSLVKYDANAVSLQEHKEIVVEETSSAIKNRSKTMRQTKVEAPMDTSRLQSKMKRKH
jgi:hypothetical protein